jgi:hypothetical protein
VALVSLLQRDRHFSGVRSRMTLCGVSQTSFGKHHAKTDGNTLWLVAQEDNAVSSGQEKIVYNLTSKLGKRCHLQRGKVCPATAKLFFRSVGLTTGVDAGVFKNTCQNHVLE